MIDLRSIFPYDWNMISESLQKTWGVLKLALVEGSYTWDFIPVSGSHDTGTGVCH